MSKLRILELYSGIGGFHFALEELGLPVEVVGAADINNVANSIYTHNFPDSPIMQRAIEALSVKDLDRLSPDLIHMSPPCQPFVRVGKQQDAGDRRTASFLHLIELIPKLAKKPQYLFLENVKGFDTSDTRSVLLQMLQQHGYVYQEMLLSPVQFGIPNSRLRYYLLAKLDTHKLHFTTSQQIMEELPACMHSYLVHRVTSVTGCHGNKQGGNHGDDKQTVSSSEVCGGVSELSPSTVGGNSRTMFNSRLETPISDKDLLNDNDSSQVAMNQLEDIQDINSDNSSDKTKLNYATGVRTASDHSIPLYKRCEAQCHPLSDYLETGSAEYLDQFLVPDKFLPRFWSMDIVRPTNRNCCCFTKRYGHHIEGAGSVIQTHFTPGQSLPEYKAGLAHNETIIKKYKLRFFTPREISNLMCFPPRFGFPSEVSTIQCYRVLGNSLNVHVVAVLLRLLILGDQER